MSLTPTTDRRRPTPPQDGGSLPAAEQRRLLVRLAALELELESRMRSAAAALQTIRDHGDPTDPEVQEPLMSALHALDVAERATVDLVGARRRVVDGTFGRCVRCDAELVTEPLELHLATQLCARCAR